MHIGGWLSDEGKAYLDLSLQVDTPEEAHELSRKYGQLAFYDVAKGDVVNVMTEADQLKWEQENNVGATRKAFHGRSRVGDVDGGGIGSGGNRNVRSHGGATGDRSGAATVDGQGESQCSVFSQFAAEFKRVVGELSKKYSPVNKSMAIDQVAKKITEFEGVIDVGRLGNRLIVNLGDWCGKSEQEEIDRMCAECGCEVQYEDECGHLEEVYPGCQLVKSFKDHEWKRFRWQVSQMNKEWREELHPRGDDGRFIDKLAMDEAAKDPAKASLLFARVTDDDNRQKLIDALKARGMDENAIKSAIAGIPQQPKPKRTLVVPERSPTDSVKVEDGRQVISQSKDWRDWNASAESIEGMDKATMKAALAKLELPPPLPNDPKMYFNMNKAHMVVDAHFLTSEKEFEQESAENAAKLMGLAAVGNAGKRDPIKVTMKNGVLTIVDGNATTNAAKANNCHVAVEIVPSDPSNWFKPEELKTKETPKPLSAQASYDEHAKAANENMDESEDSFRSVLDFGRGLSAAMSGQLLDYERSLEVAAQNDFDPIVVFGPIKTAESAERKVKAKYKGDYKQLGDVVRGSVIVDRLDKIGPTMAVLRREAEERGWKVAPGSGENKFENPTPAGYMDASLSLLAPNVR